MEIIFEWGKSIRAEFWHFVVLVGGISAFMAFAIRFDFLMQQRFVISSDDVLCFFEVLVCTTIAASLVYYPTQVSANR